MGAGVDPKAVPDSHFGGDVGCDQTNMPYFAEGRIYANAADNASGTVQNTEYVLETYTLPAGGLNGNGQSLNILIVLNTTANGDAKTYKFIFGSNTVQSVTGDTSNNKIIVWKINITRTGANTQRIVSVMTIDATQQSPVIVDATETDTSAIVIKASSINTGAAHGSATGKMMVIEALR